jgi:hypothetical protein
VEALPPARRAKVQTLTPAAGKIGPVPACADDVPPLKSPGMSSPGHVGSCGSIVTGMPARNTCS